MSSANYRQRLFPVTALFLAAHLLVGFGQYTRVWGLDQLIYLPTWFRIGFTLCSASLLLLAWKPTWSSSLHGLPENIDPWSGGALAWSLRTGIALFALFLFTWLDTATHLLGDGYLTLRSLSFQSDRFDNEPFLLWLIRRSYDLGMSTASLSPATTYRLISYTSGVCYLLLTFPVARILTHSRLQRLIILSFLVTPGFVQFFFGYVENYPLLLPGMLLYLLSGLRYLRGSSPLWLCSCLLAALVAGHFFLSMLVPSLVLLALIRLGIPARLAARIQLERDRKPENHWRALISLALFPLVLTGILTGIGFDVSSYLGNLRDSHLLPLWGEPDPSQAYSLVAPGHWWDFLNQQLLVAPAALLILLAIGGNARNPWNGDRLFLAGASLFPLAFSFLANPEIGFFRDWDILSLPALPLVLWAALAFIERLPPPLLTVSSLLVCGAAALHTLAWVALNADAHSAVQRYTRLLETASLSQNARAYGWEGLGAHHRNRGEREQALNAYGRAAAASPQNWRYWMAIAENNRHLGRLSPATEAYEKVLELKPRALDVWNLLGTLYRQLGRHQESAAAHASSLKIDPYQADVWYNLGNAHALVGRLDEAIEAFERALALDDRQPDIHFNLGLLYELRKDGDGAEKAYRAALALDADYAMAHYKLAHIYARREAREQTILHARRYLQSAAGDERQTEEIHRLLREAEVP